MNKFRKNPLQYIGVMLGIELQPDRFNIAKRVYDQYFTYKKPYEQQLDEIEKVSNIFGKPK